MSVPEDRKIRHGLSFSAPYGGDDSSKPFSQHSICLFVAFAFINVLLGFESKSPALAKVLKGDCKAPW